MTSRGIRLMVFGCLAACVWLHATPVHAALQSAGILDRATLHFQSSLTKWGSTTTNAATVLFWMLATITLCWELGGLALRGAGMETVLGYLLRFAFILGVWLYVLQNAVPLGTAIIDSLRKLGATASGLPQNLMPSGILDIGFGIFWKAITFVGSTGLSAPVVAACALFLALLILMAFAITAINMLLLIVSQWFLLYGGIFFLGFGVAPWGSDKARNYLYLSLSIGAQLFGMAGVIGLGQSFIQEQYSQLSGDTNLGELAVILIVAVMICVLANEIPKLFARFVPGSWTPQGFGMATMLGGMASLAAAVGASAAMAKGAASSVAGVIKAANAAHSVARMQSQPSAPARSQTGLGSGGGGSIGPAGVSSSDRGNTRTQGPLSAMLNASGMESARSSNSANSVGSSTRATTSTPTTNTQKTAGQQSTPKNAKDNSGNAAEQASSAGGPSSATAQAETLSQPKNASSPRGGTHAGEQLSLAALGVDAEQSIGERSAAEGSSDVRGDAEASESGDGTQLNAEQDQSDSSPEPRGDTSTSDDEPTSAAVPAAESAASTAAAMPSSITNGDTATANNNGVTGAVASRESSSDASSQSAPTQRIPASSGASTGSSPAASGAGIGAQQAARGPGGGPSSANAANSTGAQSSTTQAAPNTPSAEKVSASSSSADASNPVGARGAESGAATEPAGPQGNASAPTPQAGAQRGSTAIGSAGTLVAAAKILGEHAVQHQLGRLRLAKEAFLAHADQTTGGQIAQAIRNSYGLDNRSSTTISNETSSLVEPMTPSMEASALDVADTADTANTSPQSGPEHPTDRDAGNDPMTDKQWQLLEQKLGDEVDPSMTKAEAALLIEELLNDGD